MKLEMTELGPVKRSLKIEVPEETVNKEFHRVYSELKRQVRVPGFRQGKAPEALLEKRYARAVEQDVVQRLVPDYYQRAIKEAGVVPIVVEIPPLERMKIKRNSAFSFTATVEIKPKIELCDYRPPNPISLKKDDRAVTDEQVDRALQTLREQHAQVDAVAEGIPLSDGMVAIVSMEGHLDGVPVEGAKKAGHVHKVGAKTPILGVDVDEYLLGKRAGEQIDIPQEYPSNHPDERLAGKTVVFKVIIDAVKQQTLPELDDEFAKDCGDYESLTQLRDHLRAQLEQVLKRDVEEGYKAQIIERLLQMHHFDIPEPLIDRELKAMVRQKMLRDYRNQEGKGSLDEPVRLQEEATKLQQEFHPEAKRRVKLALILEEIADKEGLTVNQDEIEEEFNKLAKAIKISREEIKQMVEAGGQQSYDEFRERILTDKALQLVYQGSVIQG